MAKKVLPKNTCLSYTPLFIYSRCGQW